MRNIEKKWTPPYLIFKDSLEKHRARRMTFFLSNDVKFALFSKNFKLFPAESWEPDFADKT